MMSFRLRHFVIAGLLLLARDVLSPAMAEEAADPATPFLVRSWQTDQGLPNNTVKAITQTRDGYIWLGTDGGLVRFNGESFTAFTTQTGALKDNEVWALQEDEDGGLWIGTYGSGLVRYKDGIFTQVTTAQGLPDNFICSITEDERGYFWIGSHNGIFRVSPNALADCADARVDAIHSKKAANATQTRIE